jgi:hypothetical protein
MVLYRAEPPDMSWCNNCYLWRRLESQCDGTAVGLAIEAALWTGAFPTADRLWNEVLYSRVLRCIALYCCACTVLHCITRICRTVLYCWQTVLLGLVQRCSLSEQRCSLSGHTTFKSSTRSTLADSVLFHAHWSYRHVRRA